MYEGAHGKRPLPHLCLTSLVLKEKGNMRPSSVRTTTRSTTTHKSDKALKHVAGTKIDGLVHSFRMLDSRCQTHESNSRWKIMQSGQPYEIRRSS